MIESFVRFADPGPLPLSLRAHLAEVEEAVLERAAWAPGSPLFPIVRAHALRLQLASAPPPLLPASPQPLAAVVCSGSSSSSSGSGGASILDMFYRKVVDFNWLASNWRYFELCAKIMRCSLFLRGESPPGRMHIWGSPAGRSVGRLVGCLFRCPYYIGAVPVCGSPLRAVFNSQSGSAAYGAGECRTRERAFHQPRSARS